MENVYEWPKPKRIEEEAAAWLIKLDDDCAPTAADLKAFQAWKAHSPMHAEIFKRYSTYWDEEAILAELAIPLAPSSKRTSGSIFKLFKIFSPLTASGALTLLLVVSVAVGSGVGLFQWQESIAKSHYQTAIGGQALQTLADGSVIFLNTDTRLKVDYSEQSRKIFLLQGEAHFDVESDPARPFEVYAGSGMVRAVGTAFSVHLANNEIEVQVSEGKVDLAGVKPDTLITKGARLLGAPVKHSEPEPLGSLEAGQTAVFEQGKINELQTLDQSELARQQSWRSGLLTFKGEPLSSVVTEINRYTDITVEIADAELEKIQVGGRFKVSDIDGVLDLLEADFGVQVRRLNDNRIQLRIAPSQ